MLEGYVLTHPVVDLTVTHVPAVEPPHVSTYGAPNGWAASYDASPHSRPLTSPAELPRYTAKLLSHAANWSWSCRL